MYMKNKNNNNNSLELTDIRNRISGEGLNFEENKND